MESSSRTNTLISGRVVASRRAFETLALVSFALAGCASADEWEPIAESADALVFENLKFPLNQLPVKIRNLNSGKCLDVPGGTTAHGTTMQQYTCGTGSNQTFFLIKSTTGNAYQIRAGHVGHTVLGIDADSNAAGADLKLKGLSAGALFGFASFGDGTYRIGPNHNSKCLDVANGSAANHAAIEQIDCNLNTHQRWTITPRWDALPALGQETTPPMHLIAKHSTRCVDVAGASTSNHASAQQFRCGDGANQRWGATDINTVTGKVFISLVAQHSGKCLDVPNASTANHVNLQQFSCHGGDNQKWEVVEHSDGYVSFKNKNSGKCLDVAGAGQGDNVDIQQFTCHSGDNQRFFWSVFEERHIQLVEIWNGNATQSWPQSDTAVNDHIARANGIFAPYGLRLVYDPNTDKSIFTSDTLFGLSYEDQTIRTCPDNTTGTTIDCANRVAARYWPNKVVVFSKSSPGNSFSWGDWNFIGMARMDASSNLVCTNVPNTQWLAHEFGHYMGLHHTFPGNHDFLSDTIDDPWLDACLGPHAEIVSIGGQTVNTRNLMSYYYNVSPYLKPMQRSLLRATAYARGY